MTRSVCDASRPVLIGTRSLYKYWCRCRNEPLTQANGKLSFSVWEDLFSHCCICVVQHPVLILKTLHKLVILFKQKTMSLLVCPCQIRTYVVLWVTGDALLYFLFFTYWCQKPFYVVFLRVSPHRSCCDRIQTSGWNNCCNANLIPELAVYTYLYLFVKVQRLFQTEVLSLAL